MQLLSGRRVSDRETCRLFFDASRGAYYHAPRLSESAWVLRMTLVLLPALRFAVRHHVEPDGKEIYLSSDGCLLCPHGEKSSTICHWLVEEKAARAKGQVPRRRGGVRAISSCDCQNTEGLNTAPGDEVKPPVLPASLFAFLEEQQTETVMVKGREARRAPHLTGPTFVTTTGALVCRHGFSRKSLIEKKRSSVASTRRPACGCELQALPARQARLGGVALGKFCKKPRRVCPHISQAMVTVDGEPACGERDGNCSPEGLAAH